MRVNAARTYSQPPRANSGFAVTKRSSSQFVKPAPTRRPRARVTAAASASVHATSLWRDEGEVEGVGEPAGVVAGLGEDVPRVAVQATLADAIDGAQWHTLASRRAGK